MGIRCIAVIPPFTQRFQAFSDPTTPTISLVSTGAAPGEKTPLRVWTFPDGKFLNGYVEEWSLDIQRQVSTSLMIEAAYIGNHGVKGINAQDINVPRTLSAASLQTVRPWPSFGPIFPFGNNQFNFYNGLQVKATKRFTHGLSFLGSYTYAKALDNASQLDRGIPQDLQCPQCEKGLSDFDERQRFTLSYAYQLPLGNGRAWLSNRSPLLGPFVDGWELGGIVTLERGTPTTAMESEAIGDNTGETTRPDCVGNPNLPSSQRSVNLYWNRAAFVDSVPYTYGTCGRNTLIGPGVANWDFSLRKDFPFRFWSDQAGLEFRTEAFNFLNHPIFGMPVSDIDSPAFGQISSFNPLYSPREIQFALRLHW